MPLTFGVPAQLSGALEVEDATWALLYFHNEAAFGVEATDASLTNHSIQTVNARSPVQDGSAVDFGSQPEQEEAGLWPSIAMQAGFGRGWGSLYVEAESIRLDVLDVDAEIVTVDGGLAELYRFREMDAPQDSSKMYGHPTPARSIAVAPMAVDADQRAAFTLNASGLTRVEWHNATTSCQQADCPDGARDAGQRVESPDGTWAQTRTMHYNELRTRHGSVNGQGFLYGAVLGSRSPALAVNGTLRLPAAHAGSCDYLDPAGATLAAEGTIRLAALRWSDDGRARADLSGDLDALRLDEETVALDSGVPDIVVVVGGLALLLAMAKAAALFTRVSGRRVLGHDVRRRIHDFIEANPGACYGEIRTGTRLSNGSLDYNLKVLKHQGVVTTRKMLNRTHHFLARDFSKKAWRRLALLRDSENALLHAWIQGHPGTPQQEVLAAAEAAGLRRTATQKRLRRLADEGLLYASRDGRHVRYEAAT